MKKFIITLLTVILCCSYSPVCVNTVNNAENTITAENSPELWEKFLKYDLCITYYNSLTKEEKDLCKFIFNTELNVSDTVVCERARRILAGYNAGERVTLDTLIETPHIEDKTLYCYNDYMKSYWNYIDAVPDIKHIDYDNSEYEYWLNDSGTEKIIEKRQDLDNRYYRYEKYDENTLVKCIDISEELTRPEVISNGVFDYFKYSNNTLYVYYPVDKTSEVYEVPEEVDGMSVIGLAPEAFKDCRNCIKISLPENLEYIETKAFDNCSNLINVNIPNNLKAMGNWVFSQCDSFSNVVIDTPDAMISSSALSFSVVDDAYLNFKSAGSDFVSPEHNITLGDDVIKIGSAFVDSKATESSEIIIPETVKVIINDYFKKFTEDVVIPEHIEVFGAYQFSAVSEVHEPWNEKSTPAYIAVLDDEWYLSDDTVISGYYGTEAHNYALKHNIKFSPLDDLNYGDANNDGNINIADIVLLHKYLFGKGDVDYEADLTKYDIIDSFDMIYMRKMILNHQ